MASFVFVQKHIFLAGKQPKETTFSPNWRTQWQSNNQPVESPRHTAGGWGGVAHVGAAARSGAGQDGMPTRMARPGNDRPSSPPGHRGQLSWMTPCKHEQRNSYVNRRRNTIRGWPVVCPRFIRRTTATVLSWLLTSGPTPTCLCKPVSCQACPGISSGTGCVFSLAAGQ